MSCLSHENPFSSPKFCLPHQRKIWTFFPFEFLWTQCLFIGKLSWEMDCLILLPSYPSHFSRAIPQGLTPICYSQCALSQVETLDYYRISHQPLHKQKMNQFLSQSSPLTSAVPLLKHWFLTTMSGTQSLTLGKLWTKQNPFPETGQLKPLEWSSTVVSCCMLVIRVQIDSYFIIILQILP